MTKKNSPETIKHVPENEKTKPQAKPEKKQEIKPEIKQSPALQKEISDNLKTLSSETLTEAKELSENDLKDLEKNYSELLKELQPETQEYVKSMQPRLNKVLNEIQANNIKKLNAENIELITNFLEDEEKNISKIKDQKSRDLITALLHQALNTQNLEKQISDLQRMELISLGTDLIPLIGPAKMLYESGSGNTISGKKLSMTDRTYQAGAAIAFGTLDTVSLLAAGPSLFTSLIGEEALKGAIIGGTRTLPQAVKLASTLKRLAALIRKTTGLTQTSKTIFKIGSLMQKSPATTKKIFDLIASRRSNHQAKMKELEKKAQAISKSKKII